MTVLLLMLLWCYFSIHAFSSGPTGHILQLSTATPISSAIFTSTGICTATAAPTQPRYRAPPPAPPLHLPPGPHCCRYWCVLPVTLV